MCIGHYTDISIKTSQHWYLKAGTEKMLRKKNDIREHIRYHFTINSAVYKMLSLFFFWLTAISLWFAYRFDADIVTSVYFALNVMSTCGMKEIPADVSISLAFDINDTLMITTIAGSRQLFC